MIDQPVVLPPLVPPMMLPKDLQNQVSAENGMLSPILITAERATIIKGFVENLRLPAGTRPDKRRQGWILSRPHGQGKSILAYLLACAAYANNCLLTYIVRVSFSAFFLALLCTLASETDTSISTCCSAVPLLCCLSTMFSTMFVPLLCSSVPLLSLSCPSSVPLLTTLLFCPSTTHIVIREHSPTS